MTRTSSCRSRTPWSGTRRTCGDGRVTRELIRRGATVTGLDIADAPLANGGASAFAHWSKGRSPGGSDAVPEVRRDAGCQPADAFPDVHRRTGEHALRRRATLPEGTPALVVDGDHKPGTDLVAELDGLGGRQSTFPRPGHNTHTQRKSGRAGRAPLLFIAFGQDHLVPPSATRRTMRQHGTTHRITAYRQFAGRPHFPAAPGWEAVADFALTWTMEQASL